VRGLLSNPEPCTYFYFVKSVIENVTYLIVLAEFTS